MKIILHSILASMLLVLAAPAYSDVSTQMWRCEMGDDLGEEEVAEMATRWLAAAKKTEGGENLKMHLLFPVAVNATGQVDVLLVVVAPSFTEWGKFWDGYKDSPAAQLDGDNKGKLVCPDSTLWEAVSIE